MNGFNWTLDDLKVNTETSQQRSRGLTRQEIFVLGWLIGHTQDRNPKDLMRDCKVTPEQCHDALEGLLELGLLRLR